jgi:hypothetical protein
MTNPAPTATFPPLTVEPDWIPEWVEQLASLYPEHDRECLESDFVAYNRARTAFHEAGHCIAALSHGVGVSLVSVVPTAQYTGRTQYLLKDSNFIEVFLLLCHAGVAAELPYFELGAWLDAHGLRGMSDDDIVERAKSLEGGHLVQRIIVGSAQDRMVEPWINPEAFSDAQETLRAHVDAVVGVAQALLEYGTLEQEQILEVAGLAP